MYNDVNSRSVITSSDIHAQGDDALLVSMRNKNCSRPNYQNYGQNEMGGSQAKDFVCNHVAQRERASVDRDFFFFSPIGNAITDMHPISRRFSVTALLVDHSGKIYSLWVCRLFLPPRSQAIKSFQNGAYSSVGVKLVLGRGEHILSISTSAGVNGYVPHMLDPHRG